MTLYFLSEMLDSNVSWSALSVVPCDYTAKYTFFQKQFVLHINNSIDTNENCVEHEFKSNTIVGEFNDVP